MAGNGTLQLHECRISRRGKAAKGTVVVKTFGKPLLDENGIAKKWDFSHADNHKREDILALAKGIASENVALMVGFDSFLKSENLKNQGQVQVLANRIMAEDLATDMGEAVKLAQLWLTTRYNLRSSGTDEDEIEMVASFDILFARRKKAVDKLKKEGGWVSKSSPRLVKPESIEVDDEDDEDSE